MDNRIVHQLGMRDGLAIALAKYRHQGTDAFQELEATVAKKESFIHHLGELDAYSFILMLVQEHGAKEGLKNMESHKHDSGKSGARARLGLRLSAMSKHKD